MPITQSAPVMLRVKHAAAFLGIAQSTFWKWSHQGKLPRGIRLSARCTVWKVDDLKAFLERQSSPRQQ